MVDFRAELAALVAAYDIHRKWTINAVFERLRQAVEHARDVLAQPEPAPAAVGEAEELAKWLYYLAAERTCNRRRGIRPHPSSLTRAAVLLERQALRPISVSERLPGPEDCVPHPRTKRGNWCWGFERCEVPLTRPALWMLMCMEVVEMEASHWLPAHALPLPEVE